MVEDIITGLSRIKWLLTIARNSSFAFDAKRIGRELGVRYVLEGSVRKVGDRVRINALLVDATMGDAAVGGSLRSAFGRYFYAYRMRSR